MRGELIRGGNGGNQVRVEAARNGGKMARTSYFWPIALLVGFGLLIGTAPALAGSIVVAAGWSVDATNPAPVYTVGTPYPPYDGDEAFGIPLPGTTVSSGTLIPMDPKPPVPDSMWQFAGTLTWSESYMTADRSGTAGAEVAEADFAAGGELTLEGLVTNLQGQSVHNGELLVGDLGAFTLQESGPNTDDLDVIAGIRVTVTGGLLTTPGAMEIPVGTQYDLAFTLIGANNGLPGGVDDFTKDIYTTDGSQFLMGYVPEPASATLLMMGGLVLMGRRKR